MHLVKSGPDRIRPLVTQGLDYTNAMPAPRVTRQQQAVLAGLATGGHERGGADPCRQYVPPPLCEFRPLSDVVRETERR